MINKLGFLIFHIHINYALEIKHVRAVRSPTGTLFIFLQAHSEP